jgi:chromate reductase, NAD(P)H dehydrogenase (quinone)
MKICILAFSEGHNLTLAKEFQKELLSQGASPSIVDIVKTELPIYTTLTGKSYDPSTLIAPFRELLDADGFVCIAPEYNGGPPPAFSNFLAWVSCSTKDWREVFNNKPAVIATHSGGGGLNVLMMMRLQLAYVGMNVLGRQIHVTSNKPLDPASLKIVCENLLCQRK